VWPRRARLREQRASSAADVAVAQHLLEAPALPAAHRRLKEGQPTPAPVLSSAPKPARASVSPRPARLRVRPLPGRARRVATPCAPIKGECTWLDLFGVHSPLIDANGLDRRAPSAERRAPAPSAAHPRRAPRTRAERRAPAPSAAHPRRAPRRARRHPAANPQTRRLVPAMTARRLTRGPPRGFRPRLARRCAIRAAFSPHCARPAPFPSLSARRSRAFASIKGKSTRF
jgi:hypothetical protein